MSQQQPCREEYGNVGGRAQHQQGRQLGRDQGDRQQQEYERWKEECGTRAGNNPDPPAGMRAGNADPYGFATGYGAPDAPRGPHGGMRADFGAGSGGRDDGDDARIYESTTTTYGIDPNAGQFGGDGCFDAAVRNVNRNVNMNRDDKNRGSMD